MHRRKIHQELRASRGQYSDSKGYLDEESYGRSPQIDSNRMNQIKSGNHHNLKNRK